MRKLDQVILGRVEHIHVRFGFDIKRRKMSTLRTLKEKAMNEILKNKI
jgi:hypothetical protein